MKEFWQVTGIRLTSIGDCVPKSGHICMICLMALGKAVAIPVGDTGCAFCGADHHRLPVNAIEWGAIS